MLTEAPMPKSQQLDPRIQYLFTLLFTYKD
jgi:hypothetical protein